MKRTTPELNKVWGRALRAVLMILPLGLSGCFDENLPPAGSFGLAVSVSGSGQVTSSPAGIACGSDCAETLAAGSSITLSATPASGAMFTGWGGDCSGSTPSCTLTMSASRAVTASFTFSIDPPPPAAQYTLSVSVTGTGSVSSTPAGISCGADCTENYPDGTSVTLTATPGTGFQFSSWSDACSGTASCTPAMSANRAVTATFTANPPPAAQYTLSISVTGNGSVSSTPAGISCGADCTENYADGTSVTLTATPGTGFQFSSWGGACSGTGSCVVAMSAARSVSASFTPALRALTVTINGTGSVTSTPTGINCGTDCSENYAHGSNVTLTASPGANQQFSGWLGACSGTVTSCVLTMSEARGVTATFTPIPAAQFTLTVTAGITGSGLITSTPAGISCGTDCTESYASGASVTLTATPEMGFQFSGWGGACSGSGACVVVMSANRTVAATFSRSSEDLIFLDNFEYTVGRDDTNAVNTFVQQGRWNHAKTMQTQNSGNGYLYTVDQIPGYSGPFPGGASRRVLAMEALPNRLGFQTDFYLQLGVGEQAAYDNYIPSNVWFQFWVYINHFGDQLTRINEAKFIYPCDSFYPCSTNKWMMTIGSWSQTPLYQSLGEPTSSIGAFLQHPATGTVIENPPAPSWDRWKLGQTNTSQYMAANRWTLVKIHLDTSTTSGRYEAWMRPQGSASWTKTSEWIDGASPQGFVWRINPGGHRVIRIPTTFGSASGGTSYDAWIYMDDFAMARSEAGLPQYSLP